MEHIKHSPTCGWAIMTAIEADLGEYRQLHPLEPALIDARKATFGGRWPYESKKGFKCKTKQLAEAGWKYTPTLESDDMATCAYCQLALDGWEAGDKPMLVARRHCVHISLANSPLVTNTKNVPPTAIFSHSSISTLPHLREGAGRRPKHPDFRSNPWPL